MTHGEVTIPAHHSQREDTREPVDGCQDEEELADVETEHPRLRHRGDNQEGKPHLQKHRKPVFFTDVATNVCEKLRVGNHGDNEKQNMEI